jgi:hypothetical protein
MEGEFAGIHNVIVKSGPDHSNLCPDDRFDQPDQ